MIGKRTSLSLAQYLEIHNHEFVKILLEKYDFNFAGTLYPEKSGPLDLNSLKDLLCAATQAQLHALSSEIIQTSDDLRARLEHKFRQDEIRHDGRFDDLKKCLLLDGFNVANRKLIPQDPTILEAPSVEDDLTLALQSCNLVDASAVVQKIKDSTTSFRQTNPNFNASLTDARVALQTLAASIAKARQPNHAGNFDETSWGSVLAYLRNSGFVTDDQEKGLAGVFRFVSPGAHLPLGLSEMEMTRLGRSFVLGMCWFLVKRFTSETAK